MLSNPHDADEDERSSESRSETAAVPKRRTQPAMSLGEGPVDPLARDEERSAKRSRIDEGLPRAEMKDERSPMRPSLDSLTGRFDPLSPSARASLPPLNDPNATLRLLLAQQQAARGWGTTPAMGFGGGSNLMGDLSPEVVAQYLQLKATLGPQAALAALSRLPTSQPMPIFAPHAPQYLLGYPGLGGVAGVGGFGAASNAFGLGSILGHPSLTSNLDFARQQLLLGLPQSAPMPSVARLASPVASLPAVLAQPEDSLKLSSHQVFLRHQIEAFQATQDDVSTHTRGRNKPITIGQVGIRCRHCAHLPVARRQKGSTYFPASLLGLYQAAQNMSTTHMQCGLCTEMPDSIKREFVHLLSSKSTSSGAGRPYWATSAEKLGLVDTEDGIRFLRDIGPGTKILPTGAAATKK